MESIIWSNGRIRKLSIFMLWIPKQPLELDVRKETLHYCLKSKRLCELCCFFHKTLYWSNWSDHSPLILPDFCQEHALRAEHLTLKKQQSPKQRADQEAKGNAALVSSAVKSRGRHFIFLHPCFPLPYLLLDLYSNRACRTQLASRPWGRCRKGRTCTPWALLPWSCSFNYHWPFLKVPNSTWKSMTLRAAREVLLLLRWQNSFWQFLMGVGLSSRGESEYHVKLMLASAQPLFKDIKGRGLEKPSWEAIRLERSMHRYLRICIDACGAEQTPGSPGLLPPTEFINKEKR